MSFDENKYRVKMTQIRNKVSQDFRTLASNLSEGKISEHEFKKIKERYLDQVNQERKELLFDREQAIKEQAIKYQQKLGDNSDRFRDVYEKLQSMRDSDQLERYYSTSLKLDDQIGMKAAALLAQEKMIRPIVEDYAKRDQAWAETVKELSEFNQKHRSPNAKLEASLDHYRHISEPPCKREQYQVGTFQDDSGRQRPFYRERITYD